MTKLLGDKKSYVGATLIFASFLLSTLLLSLVNVSNVFAYTASLSTSGTVTTNVAPNTEGDKSISINQDSVNVVTNCRAGYNLTISSSVTDRNLYKDGNSANNTSGQYFTPVNGTAQLNNTTNQYGYSLTANTESGVFTPLPLPSAPTFIKTPSQTASQTDINDDIPVYYGVSAANTLNPGLYKLANSGTILYQLTLDESCMTFTVNFNANGGTGTMTNQDITVDQATNLKANSFTAPARGQSYQNAAGTTIPATADKMWAFWGWNTEVDGSGDWYKDRESVTNLTNAGDTITLYAQWKQATLADLTTSTPGQNKTIDHNTMQDMSAATCWNSDKFTAIGTPYGQATLIDTRDGNTRAYTVARLPDGYCWMTQNLNLGTSTAITLTSDDTDLEEGTTFTLPASDPTDFSTTGSETNFNKATILNNITIPDYTVNGTTYSNKVTGYYSYAAATANTTTYSTSSSNTIFINSICPKNWDLPTTTQYYNLRTKGSIATYNNTTASYEGKNAGNEPYYFVYGGYRRAAGATIDTTTFYNPTTYGYLWTANNYSAYYGRGTYVNSSGLYSSSVGNNYYKYYGFGIRCVSNMDKIQTKITFVNTDTGETQTQIIGLIGESNTITLQQHPTTWTKSGYNIAGWDTNSAGTNVVYTKGQSVTLSSDITLYAVWKPAYTLQYDGNGADEGVMTNVKHTNVYEGDTFDLFASNYSKAGYGFAGWSFDQNAQPGGASRIYGPNEAITAPAGTSGGTKTLYAVWVASAGNIQDWKGCSTMNIGDVTALKDTRDNQVYSVGKLADENCWMMENLRLDTANSSDSTKAQGFGGAFVGLADSESANFSNVTTANTLSGNTLYSTDNISGDNQGYRFPRYNNINTSARSTGPSATDNRATTISAHSVSLNTNIYSYGNYYTWAATVANTENLTVNAKSSLCPSGWKLPYGYTSLGNTSGGFYYLGSKLGAITSSEASSRIWRSYPNNNVYAGYFSAASASARGSSMYNWSSTINSGSVAYYNSLSTASINYSATNNKATGQSIRCIAEKGLEVKLMLNDGTGRVGGRVYGEAGSTVTLPLLNTEEGYYYTGWNTIADGSGINYTSSYTFSPSATTGITLYAQRVATDCPAGKICYDANSSNVEGTMGQQTVANAITSINLMASNFSKSGYGFAGWSTKADGTGTKYGPNETIEFLAGAFQKGGLKLYAMWIASNGNIQSWTGCSSMNIGDVTALTDQRDNQTYAVARLVDGNCWMIENLRLEAQGTRGLANKALAQGYGGVFDGLADAESATFSNTTTANSLYYSGNQSGTATIDIGTINNPGYRFPRYNNINTQSRADNPTGGNANIYSYGNYYTWSAAIADTTYYSNANTSITNTSICPTGWRLPRGGNKTNEANNDYWNLVVNRLNNGVKPANYDRSTVPFYTSTDGADSIGKLIRKYPNNFLNSGRINSASFEANSNGEYFTSTVAGSNRVHLLYFNNSYVIPGTDVYSYGFDQVKGRSVRCLVSQANTGSSRITFDKNASTATGTMGNQTINAGTSVALTTNGFSRSGYIFNSWNTEADGSGVSYTNEQLYYANAGNETTNVTLYAIWDKVWTVTFNLGSGASSISFDGVTYTNGQTVQVIEGKTYIIGGNYPTKYAFNSWNVTAGTLGNSNAAATNYTVTGDATITLTGQQATIDMTTLTNPSTPSANCKNEPVNPQLVYDPRDNEAYWVAQLCDGNIWMLDNLRLDLTNSSTLNNLSTSNTNNTEQALSCLKTGYYNGDACSDPYTSAAASTSFSPKNRASINANFKDNIAPVVYGVGSGKLGVYYNYCATSGGSYCFSGGTLVDVPNTSIDSPYDLCPVGWRLPTGDSLDSEMSALISSYNGGSIRVIDAFSASLSGTSSSSNSVSYLGQEGNYWSSTYNGSYDWMVYTRVMDGALGAGNASSISVGRSVRCMLNH